MIRHHRGGIFIRRFHMTAQADCSTSKLSFSLYGRLSVAECHCRLLSHCRNWTRNNKTWLPACSLRCSPRPPGRCAHCFSGNCCCRALSLYRNSRHHNRTSPSVSGVRSPIPHHARFWHCFVGTRCCRPSSHCQNWTHYSRIWQSVCGVTSPILHREESWHCPVGNRWNRVLFLCRNSIHGYKMRPDPKFQLSNPVPVDRPAD